VRLITLSRFGRSSGVELRWRCKFLSQ
jgi:hypothetical protein